MSEIRKEVFTIFYGFKTRRQLFIDLLFQIKIHTFQYNIPTFVKSTKVNTLFQLLCKLNIQIKVFILNKMVNYIFSNNDFKYSGKLIEYWNTGFDRISKFFTDQ